MGDPGLLFLELGGVIVLLALVARLAVRFSLSPIPLYLIAGLTLGEGGIVELVTSEGFVEIGAGLGVILLLLMMGLEYTASELVQSLKTTASSGIVDFVINYTPGFVAGLILGLGVIPSLFLGGVTYISSSGVAAKLLSDLEWMGNRETPMVLSLLVFEDLAMAVVLPILGGIALGGALSGILVSVPLALVVVALILLAAHRHGERLSELAFSSSDEVNLLTVLGITLVVSGLTERLHVSAAVGAFLVGISLSGQAAHRARELLTPLRDLFAGVFFVFFGLQTDPGELPGVALPVLALAVVTGFTKLFLASWEGKRQGISARGSRRAGALLLARGEFSIVIAGLGIAAGAPAELAAVAAGYVLIMATAGPIAARLVKG
jgi:CPA2 family monovalent cation:H+ antiporter-2